MVIKKNGKEYVIEEHSEAWEVSCKTGKLTVGYRIAKEVCADERALRDYIDAEDLF